MIANAVMRGLERCGVDRYTLMTWRSRLFARHHQALLQAAVVVAVLVAVIVLLGRSA